MNNPFICLTEKISCRKHTEQQTLIGKMVRGSAASLFEKVSIDQVVFFVLTLNDSS